MLKITIIINGEIYNLHNETKPITNPKLKELKFIVQQIFIPAFHVYPHNDIYAVWNEDMPIKLRFISTKVKNNLIFETLNNPNAYYRN
jgi:hypothetical protein